MLVHVQFYVIISCHHPSFQRTGWKQKWNHWKPATQRVKSRRAYDCSWAKFLRLQTNNRHFRSPCLFFYCICIYIFLAAWFNRICSADTWRIITRDKKYQICLIIGYYDTNYRIFQFGPRRLGICVGDNCHEWHVCVLSAPVCARL